MTYRNMAVVVDEASPMMGTRVSVDFSTQNEEKKQLAANINADDQLRFVGDVECKISIDFLLRSDGGNYSGFNFLLDNYHNTGANGMLLDIGGNQYSGCFIDSYDLTVKPFEPVVGSVSFTSFSPSPGGITGLVSANVDNVLDTQDIIYGHDCTLVNAGNVVSSNLVNNLTYNKSFSRTPVYTLGSQYASSHLVDGVEVNMDVESTGLNSLIGFSGNKLTSNFGVMLDDVSNAGLDYNSVDFDLLVNAGAHVVSESYSVQGGDTLSTRATIREIIL